MENAVNSQDNLSGKEAAVWFVECVQTAFENRIRTDHRNRLRSIASETLDVVSGSIDHLLLGVVGVPAAASAKVILELLAKRIAPDPETLRDVQAQLKVIIETPLRTGLDILKRALTLRLTSRQTPYLSSRFHDAQANLDQAWSHLSGQKAREMVPEAEWKLLALSIPLLQALSAAGQDGGREESQLLSAGPLEQLDKLQQQCESSAEQARVLAANREARLAVERRELALLEEFPPSAEAFARLRLRKMQEMKEKTFMSFDMLAADAEAHLIARNSRLANIEKITSEYNNAQIQSKIYTEKAAAYGMMAKLLRSALQELSAESDKLPA
jgi:hypothetical protein